MESSGMWRLATSRCDTSRCTFKCATIAGRPERPAPRRTRQWHIDTLRKRVLTHNAIYKTLCACVSVCLLSDGPPQTMCHPTLNVRLFGQIETVSFDDDATKVAHVELLLTLVPRNILYTAKLIEQSDVTRNYCRAISIHLFFTSHIFKNKI